MHETQRETIMSKHTYTLANSYDPTPAFMLEPGMLVAQRGSVYHVVNVDIADEKHTQLTLSALQYSQGQSRVDDDFCMFEEDPIVVPDTKAYNVIHIVKQARPTVV
jgi:hypothetical protein